MGMSTGGGGGSRVPLSEINVTPLVDVMLVLLIIFMVAAPLSTVDVAVNLPGIEATPQPRSEKPLFVTLKADLTLALGEEMVAREQLEAALLSATGGDKSKPVFLRADKTVDYGDLMKLLELLRKAGFLKVALVAVEEIQQP